MRFTLDLANEFQDSDGELGRHRAKAMETLSEIFNFSKKSKLTKEELTRWRWLNALHMFHYTKCGFAVQPKFHYFFHLPQQAERGGSVRSFWVYSDEAKNREVKAIWNKVSKGHSVTQQVLLRLEWLLGLERVAKNVLRNHQLWDPFLHMLGGCPYPYQGIPSCVKGVCRAFFTNRIPC